MTSIELYYESQLLLNKNATNVNINLEKENFVWLYNREAKRWLSDYIQKNSSNANVIDLQGVLSINKELSLVQKTKEYNTYNLPTDFYDFVDSYSTGVKGECEGVISNFLHKPKNIRAVLDNSLSSPSFEYEESICNIAEEKLIVYKKEYEIKNSYLSYYKQIEPIDLEGYQKFDGSFSTNVDTTLKPYVQSQIIDRVVTEVMREFENGNGYKVSVDRQNSN